MDQVWVGKIFNSYNPTQSILLMVEKMYVFLNWLFWFILDFGTLFKFVSLIYYGTLRFNIDKIEILDQIV